MDRITLKMTTLRGEPFEVPGYMVGQHWAMAQRKDSEGWALTHVPSAAVVGYWDEGTCLAMAPGLVIPDDYDLAVSDGYAIIAAKGFNKWCESVRKRGDVVHASRAAERLAEHVTGHQLYSVIVTREASAHVYVVAKSLVEAEAMALKADIEFDDDDLDASSSVVRAVEPSVLLDEVEAPKGFPRATVRDVAVAMEIPLPEECE
jgi:hypothetical protein